MSRKTLLSLSLFGMLCAAGCGGGGGGNSTTPTITSVSASCLPTTLQAGQTTQTSQCSATVLGTGSYSSGVTWTASAGTITSAGVYTAPTTVPTSGSATITATSTEDGTKSGTASIAITAAPTVTSVSASCNPTTLQAGQTTQTSQCSATVKGTGSFSTAVTWSASAGTITSAGVYTAPATVPTSGSATITATSTADGTKSGTANITITAAPTITSVTASCIPATLPAHQTTTTSQCSATVTGTGSYSSAVTWSAKYGAITTAGVYTAPLTVPTSGMDTITATSTEDGTKSGTANITITAARAITLTPQYPAASQAEIPGSPFAVQINATGIQTGDVIDWTEMGTTTPYTITAADVTAGYFTVGLTINENASFVQFTCATSTNAVCNPAWIAITTDQQQLVESLDGTTAYFNPGELFDIQEYSLPAGTLSGNAPLVGSVAALNTAVTVDGGTAGTGVLLSDHNLQGVNSTAGNATTGVITVSGTFPTDALASIVAWNGYGYVTEPNVANPGKVEQFAISKSTGLTVGSSVSAGDSPYAIDAATVNSADAIVVYSGVDTTVHLFNTSLTPESSSALSNITAFPTNGQPLPGAKGGWPLRIIGSGTAAGTVGVLSSYDNVLDFLTISSGNTLSWPTTAYASIAGNPYLIAPDAKHGAFVVALADTTNGVTTLERISATSPYTATAISASTLPTGFLASGLLVSADGTEIYVAGFNTLTPASPTSPTNTPLFFTITNP